MNDPYDQVRRQILLKGITPTLNQAYAMIIEYEIQYLACATTINENTDPITMHVSRSSENGNGLQNYKGKKCDYCHFTRHTKETCYKLIGYPNDWKNKRREVTIVIQEDMEETIIILMEDLVDMEVKHIHFMVNLIISSPPIISLDINQLMMQDNRLHQVVKEIKTSIVLFWPRGRTQMKSTSIVWPC